MPSISPSIAAIHRPDPEQRPAENPEQSLRNHVQNLAATMEAPDGPTHPQDLREIFNEFKKNLTQESAWKDVQHLFVPNADRHEILDALAHCHFASFELGNKYLSLGKGPAHIDSCIRCVLGKLTSEARDSMLKDLPVLTRGPKLVENASSPLFGFSPLVLTLSEIGLRLPLDKRHVRNDCGDGGLRTQETEYLFARIQKKAAKQGEIARDEARTQPAPKGPPPNTDDWLTERLRKFRPSFSARRDTTLSLNCEVKVDNKLISCGHIARLWEEDFMRTAGKPTYETLNSHAVLHEAARPVVSYDGSYGGGAIGERIDGSQYWMSNNWGRVLTENFDAMSRQAPKDGAVCRTLYLLTPNHVMALGLKIKDEADARRYVVQFYDPNITAAHQRSAISATLDQPGVPTEIRVLKPCDFLGEPELEYYALVDAEKRSVPALFFGGKVEPNVPRFTGDLPALQPRVMWAMLAHNLPEQLHAYADQLKLIDNITRLDILTSSNHLGRPGLFVALEVGHTEVIEVLGDILKGCRPPLSPTQLMSLLSIKNADGTTGLSRALEKGHAETVEAFGKLLKTCEPPLSSEQLMALLSAKGHNGFPVLYAALYNGQDGTVKAVGQLLAACKQSLSTAQIFELLSARAPEGGSPGLYAAICCAPPATIVAFGNALTTCLSSLSSEHLTDLLSAKASGITGLYSALYSGEAEKVRVFGEILKTCQPFLSAAQLMDLISAKDDQGVVGLRAALQNGRADAIEAYGKLLETVATSLPAKQLAELLASASGPGRAVLLTARTNGHAAAAAAFEALTVKFAAQA